MISESSVAGPRTIVGQWLLAGLLGQRERRDQLLSQLNGGVPQWKKFDEPHVVEVACALAIQRLLPIDVDEARISAVAADMRSKSGGARDHPSQLETEIVIRAALGDRDAPIKNVNIYTLFTSHAMAVAYVYFKLGRDRQAIVKLITDAERMTFKQGWNPPLAD